MTQSSNPLKAIREKCLDCVYNAHEVSMCVSTNCALHPFRFGKNPFRAKVKRVFTEDQKQAARENLKMARAKKKGNTNEPQ